MEHFVRAADGQAFAASYGGTVAGALTTAVSDMEAAYTDAPRDAKSHWLELDFGASSTTLH
jgi:hypothetical protein